MDDLSVDPQRAAAFWQSARRYLPNLRLEQLRPAQAGIRPKLAGYRGYLVADAHAVYDHLYVGGGVVEVDCWSHCRRLLLQGPHLRARARP